MDSREVQRLKISIRNVVFHLFLTTLFCTFFLPSLTQAGPGDLDPNFGSNGIVTTHIVGGVYGGPHASALSIALQSDGKMVVAGEAFFPFSGGAFHWVTWGIAMARYNTDGSLDPTFGTGGIIGTDEPTGAYDLGIQPDGKLVIVTGDLRRYNSDGTPDTNFGSYGRAESSVNAVALVIQPDGKLVVAGYYYGDANEKFALARYNPNGSLDTTFGNNGLAIGSNASSDDYLDLVNMAIQSDGKLVVAGSSSLGYTMIRFNTDGTLDNEFGTVIPPLIEPYRFHPLAIQSDGKIVVAGFVYDYRFGDNGRDFVVARYNSNGTLDSSFGSGGIAFTILPFEDHYSLPSALIIQSNGKIVVGGGYEDSMDFSTFGNFTIVRYNTDGALDSTFGDNGIVYIGSPRFILSGVFDFAIQPDGKLIAAGYSYSHQDSGFIEVTLARFLSDPLTTTTNCNDKNNGKGNDKGKGHDKGSCIGHSKIGHGKDK